MSKFSKLSVKQTDKQSKLRIVCPFCKTEVLRRGLRNHQISSSLCIAYQSRMQAEKDGLVPLNSGQQVYFIENKIPIRALQTKIVKHLDASRTSVATEIWGKECVAETIKSCLRIKQERFKMFEREIKDWINLKVKESLEINDVPEDVRIEDGAILLNTEDE